MSLPKKFSKWISNKNYVILHFFIFIYQGKKTISNKFCLFIIILGVVEGQMLIT